MLFRAQNSSFELTEMLIKSEYARKIRAYLALERQKYGDAPTLHFSNRINGSSPPLNFQFIIENSYGESVERPDPDSETGCQQCSPHMGKNIGCEYSTICDCLEFAHVDTLRLDTEEQREQYRNRDVEGTQGLPKRFPYRRAGKEQNKKVFTPTSFCAIRDANRRKTNRFSYPNT
jgi:[histone H3]-lysine9 N-trimethyltransferase SUV39H